MENRIYDRKVLLDDEGKEMLRCRVRHFTREVILGGRALIDGWFEALRDVKGA